MKQTLLILSVLLVVSTCLAAPEAGRTQVAGDFWFRYHVDRQDDSTQRSAFTVERGYFGLGYKWNDRVDGQMTINVFSSADQSGWDFELRDAYLNLYYFVPNGKMRVGLQKNYFGTVHDWKYLTVRRSLADAVGVVSERDYGVAFLGTLPDYGAEWTLAIMNGEGYSSGFNPPYADRQPGFMASFRFVPMTETTVGFSFLKDKRYVWRWGEVGYGSSIGYEDRTAYCFLARFGRGPLSVLGEYLIYDYPIPSREDWNEPVNVTGTGFMVFPTLRVTDKLDIVARYDMWDPDKDSDDPIWQPPSGFTSTMDTPEPWWVPQNYRDPRYYYVKHNVYVFGFNYNITKRMEGEPGVTLQVNWQRMDPEEEMAGQTLDPFDSFIFQVRWGWGGLDF